MSDIIIDEEAVARITDIIYEELRLLKRVLTTYLEILGKLSGYVIKNGLASAELLLYLKKAIRLQRLLNGMPELIKSMSGEYISEIRQIDKVNI